MNKDVTTSAKYGFVVFIACGWLLTSLEYRKEVRGRKAAEARCASADPIGEPFSAEGVQTLSEALANQDHTIGSGLKTILPSGVTVEAHKISADKFLVNATGRRTVTFEFQVGEAQPLVTHTRLSNGVAIPVALFDEAEAMAGSPQPPGF